MVIFPAYNKIKLRFTDENDVVGFHDAEMKEASARSEKAPDLEKVIPLTVSDGRRGPTATLAEHDRKQHGYNYRTDGKEQHSRLFIP